MLRLSNISIGIKLAVMSSLGVLLVIAMMATEMMGGASVTRATNKSNERVIKARDLEAIKGFERGMQLAVRDIRLAHSAEELQKAVKSLKAELKAVHGRIDPMIPIFAKPERRAAVEKIKNLIDHYAEETKAIVNGRSEAIALMAKGTAEAKAGATKLNADAERIARERTLPIVAQVEDGIEKMNNY